MNPQPPDDDPRDAHLLAALRHAPDRDVVPPAQLTAAILGQARRAVRRRGARAWRDGMRAALERLWQPAPMAAFGTLALATLIGVMWRDQEWPDATPSLRPERAVVAAEPGGASQALSRTVETPAPQPAKVAPKPAPQAPLGGEGTGRGRTTVAPGSSAGRAARARERTAALWSRRRRRLPSRRPRRPRRRPRTSRCSARRAPSRRPTQPQCRRARRSEVARAATGAAVPVKQLAADCCQPRDRGHARRRCVAAALAPCGTTPGGARRRAARLVAGPGRRDRGPLAGGEHWRRQCVRHAHDRRHAARQPGLRGAGLDLARCKRRDVAGGVGARCAAGLAGACRALVSGCGAPGRPAVTRCRSESRVCAADTALPIMPASPAKSTCP